MAHATPRAPSYRLHKASGQAVVTIGGRDLYLGKHGTAASKREYHRVLAEWHVHGGTPPQPTIGLTLTELAAAFMRHAIVYYRRPDGTPSNELKNFRLIIRRLIAIYGRTAAAEIGPLALKAVRQLMIEDGLARTTINHDVNRIRHIFKWGVENELIPPAVLHALQAVSGLRAGRSKAKETAPVRTIPDTLVDAVLEHVSPQVAAMIELQ